ncbi:MAG: hypothetical protein FWD57_11075, partial [Polyangiaceae bacterium]|nr:hypothetical protein [Polyangiaceae bacterium]
RASLFDEVDSKYLPVYVVLSGGGWLWFPPLQSYPNKPRLLDYEKRDDSPTPVFARPCNAANFEYVDSDYWDKATQHAAWCFNGAANSVPLNKVAYMPKQYMLHAAEVTATAPANSVAYPIGLTMWNGANPEKFDTIWFDQVAPPEEDDDDDLEIPRIPQPTDVDRTLTTSHASRANRGSEYGVCVASGPWTHLDRQHRCYNCILPQRYAAGPQNGQYTGVSPEGIGLLINHWGRWARDGKNPDSFLVFLSEQICYALRDRIV